MFFEWSDRLLTGNEDIDFQHKSLFDMANDLAKNMNQGPEARLLVQVLLDQLLDYTSYHFDTEESLMKKTHYPEFNTHKEAHDKLRSQVIAFRKQFANGDAEVSAELMTFLQDWLFNHIEKTDTQLAKYAERSN